MFSKWIYRKAVELADAQLGTFVGLFSKNRNSQNSGIIPPYPQEDSLRTSGVIVQMHRLHELSRILVFSICVSAGLQAFATTARFQAGQSYSAGITPHGVVIADFNKDGKQDVVVVSSYGTAQNVYVLLGNGDGTLQPASVVSVTGSLYAVAAGDFNNDGNLDLAVVDNANSAVLILLGHGDGTFAQPTTANTCLTGAQPVALAVGDLNGDGKLDVVTANYGPSTTNGANSVTVCLGDGAGGFSAPNTVTASTLSGSNANGVAIADVTGDGKPDVVVSLWQNAYSVLAGNGNGTFQAPNTQTIPAPATNPYAVAVADLNGDGKPDLVFPNGNGTSVFLGNGNGTFQAEAVYTGMGDAVVIADMNGDGKPDIVTADWSFGRVNVLTNLGGGSFSPPLTYVSGAQPYALAVGDLNGDGHLDVVAANAGVGAGVVAGNITVLLGNGDSTLRGALGFRSDRAGRLSSAGPVVSADFNGDGLPDAAVLNTGSSSVTVFIADPVLGFKPGVTYDTGNGTGANGDLDIAVGDVNGDGKLDIVTVGFGGVHILTGNGDGTFNAVSSASGSVSGQNIVVADLDGDGNADIAYTLKYGSNNGIAIQYGDGKGGFSVPSTFPPTGISTSIAVADVNGDGKLDLVAGNVGTGAAGSDTISVFINQGNRQFGGPNQFSIGPLGAAARVNLALGDVDKNGSPDVVVVEDGNGQANQSCVTIMLNNGLGGFTTLAQYPTGAALSHVAIGDFDGDGSVDLSVTSGVATYVFPGLGGGTFGTPVAYAGGGSQQGIVSAQFNNGGVPDIAVVAADDFSLSLLLNAAGTHAIFSEAPNPSVYLEPVSITATFEPAVPWAGKPTGTLTIQDGTSTLASLPVDNAQSAAFTTSQLAVGSHSMGTIYSGDMTFARRVFTVTQIVNRATPSIQLTSSANPSLTGNPVTISATLAGPSGGQPSGTLTVSEGQSTLSAQSLDASSQAQFTLASLAVGPHTLSFAYGGDSNFGTATLNFSQDVQNHTTLSLASSSATSVAGGAVTYTATISSQGPPIPTGTVNFNADGVSFGIASLNATGAAALSTTATPSGTHAITATYAGDNYSAATKSNAVSVTVADFSANPSASSATIRAGQSATLNLNVTSLGGFNSAVTFACSGLPLYATCTFSPASVTPSANASASVQMTITTAGTAVALANPMSGGPVKYFAFAILSFGGLVGIAFVPARRKRQRRLCFVGGCLMLPVILAGCGGGGGSGSNTPPPQVTPAGTSAVSISMTSSINGVSVTHSIQVNLTVTP